MRAYNLKEPIRDSSVFIKTINIIGVSVTRVYPHDSTKLTANSTRTGQFSLTL
jgi:hypothetical protein